MIKKICWLLLFFISLTISKPGTACQEPQMSFYYHDISYFTGSGIWGVCGSGTTLHNKILAQHGVSYFAATRQLDDTPEVTATQILTNSVYGLKDRTFGVLHTHASSTILGLEYWATEDEARTSGEDQGLTEDTHFYVVPQYGKYWVAITGDGARKIWSDNWSPTFAQHMGFVLLACYGSSWQSTFDNMDSMDGDWAFIAPSGLFYPNSTGGADFNTFLNRLYCVNDPDEPLDCFEYAADGIDYVGNLFSFDCENDVNPEGAFRILRPDPCDGCLNVSEGFYSIKFEKSNLVWEYSKYNMISKFVVIEEAHGEVVGRYPYEVNKNEGRRKYKHQITSFSAGRLFRVEAYSGEVVVESTGQIRQEEAFGATEEDLTKSNNSIEKNNKTDRGQVLRPCRYVTVGRDPALAQLTNSYLANSYGSAPSYIWEPDLDVSDIQEFYGNCIAENMAAGGDWPVNPGPELVICGPMGSESYCVPSFELADSEAECYNGGVCLSDLLLSDSDGDGFPEGPVTRIVARTQDEVIESIESSLMFTNLENMAPFKRVLPLCGDTYTTHEDDLIYWRTMYQNLNLDYTFTSMLKESELPSNCSDRWDSVADRFNVGVCEVVGRGTVSSDGNWFDVLDPCGSSDVAAFSKNQPFIAWLPSCHTTWNWVNGYGNYSGHNGIDAPVHVKFMHNYGNGNPTRMAAVAGFINGSDSAEGAVLSSYLADARGNVGAYSNRSVASVAYHAAINMLNDMPLHKNQALGMCVLGAPTIINNYEMTPVPFDEETVKNEWVRQGNMTGGGTNIHYRLRDDLEYILEIFDIRGRLIHKAPTKISGTTGEYLWSGRDTHGRFVSSGIYIVTAKTNDNTVKGKLMIVK